MPKRKITARIAPSDHLAYYLQSSYAERLKWLDAVNNLMAKSLLQREKKPRKTLKKG